MHGGLGFNTLQDDYFRWSGLPVKLRSDYYRSLKKLLDIPVDITLGSHPATACMMEKAAAGITDNSNPFIDPDEWKRFLNGKMRQYAEIFNDCPGE